MVRRWDLGGALGSGARAVRGEKITRNPFSHQPEPELKVQVPQAQFPRLTGEELDFIPWIL